MSSTDSRRRCGALKQPSLFKTKAVKARWSVFFVALILPAKFAEGLVYPAVSTLGLISSLSVPVVEYFPERRILIDWCFSMAYDLPEKVSSFYNVPIWPGFQNPKARSERSLPALPTQNATTSTGNALTATRDWKYDRKLDGNRHGNDFSAGELYQGIEDFLISYGFHETCLLRSVCELARHPFDDDQQEGLVTDVLTFLLTPSLHRGFDAAELVYRETYEEAEMQGFLGHTDCAAVFPACRKDLLGLLTRVVQPPA